MPHICGRCDQSTYMIYPVDSNRKKELASRGITIHTDRICASCHSLVTLVERGYTETDALNYLHSLRMQEEENSYED